MCCRTGSEASVATAKFPEFGVVYRIGDVPVFDLGRNFGWEFAGIKDRCVANTGLTFFQVCPQCFDIIAKRVDNSNTSNDYASARISCNHGLTWGQSSKIGSRGCLLMRTSLPTQILLAEAVLNTNSQKCLFGVDHMLWYLNRRSIGIHANFKDP